MNSHQTTQSKLIGLKFNAAAGTDWLANALIIH